MSETNETLADIVREMRGEKYIVSGTPDLRVRDYADRIEAVAKRAYERIDDEVTSIDDASMDEITDVREAMKNTIGDYYE